MTRVDLARLSDVASGVPSGTSFPGSPSTNDIFFRTDLGLLCYYNGTRWLTVNQYSMQMGNDTAFPPYSANGQYTYAAPWGGAFDLWLEKAYFMTSVATTNDGTKFWTVVLEKDDGTDLGSSFNTAADTASTKTFHTVTINALLGTSTKWVQTNVTKTSTPGNLTMFCQVAYRLVVT